MNIWSATLKWLQEQTLNLFPPQEYHLILRRYFLSNRWSDCVHPFTAFMAGRAHKRDWGRRTSWRTSDALGGELFTFYFWCYCDWCCSHVMKPRHHLSRSNAWKCDRFPYCWQCLTWAWAGERGLCDRRHAAGAGGVHGDDLWPGVGA